MGAAEDKASLLDIASRAFGDAADDIEAFVADGMKSLGYKPRMEWDDPEPATDQPPARRGPSFGSRPPASPPVNSRRVGGGGGPGEYQG